GDHAANSSPCARKLGQRTEHEVVGGVRGCKSVASTRTSRAAMGRGGANSGDRRSHSRRALERQPKAPRHKRAGGLSSCPSSHHLHSSPTSRPRRCTSQSVAYSRASPAMQLDSAETPPDDDADDGSGRWRMYCSSVVQRDSISDYYYSSAAYTVPEFPFPSPAGSAEAASTTATPSLCPSSSPYATPGSDIEAQSLLDDHASDILADYDVYRSGSYLADGAAYTASAFTDSYTTNYKHTQQRPRACDVMVDPELIRLSAAAAAAAKKTADSSNFGALMPGSDSCVFLYEPESAMDMTEDDCVADDVDTVDHCADARSEREGSRGLAPRLRVVVRPPVEQRTESLLMSRRPSAAGSQPVAGDTISPLLLSQPSPQAQPVVLRIKLPSKPQQCKQRVVKRGTSVVQRSEMTANAIVKNASRPSPRDPTTPSPLSLASSCHRPITSALQLADTAPPKYFNRSEGQKRRRQQSRNERERVGLLHQVPSTPFVLRPPVRSSPHDASIGVVGWAFLAAMETQHRRREKDVEGVMPAVDGKVGVRAHCEGRPKQSLMEPSRDSEFSVASEQEDEFGIPREDGLDEIEVAEKKRRRRHEVRTQRRRLKELPRSMQIIVPLPP
ncbi:uncharacterized protein V1518DRAFT_48431, partial [Limtongia smithiae]|uniref:uncharacterized protein n=1 Tax=Limtongia smithiae TaxID=1125753 RepID=UPI0034CD3F5D